jgi:hypothetical protein
MTGNKYTHPSKKPLKSNAFFVLPAIAMLNNGEIWQNMEKTKWATFQRLPISELAGTKNY